MCALTLCVYQVLRLRAVVDEWVGDWVNSEELMVRQLKEYDGIELELNVDVVEQPSNLSEAYTKSASSSFSVPTERTISSYEPPEGSQEWQYRKTWWNEVTWDTNNDGVVDQDEFLAAGGSKEQFAKFDLNGDGVLDADELQRIVPDVKSHMLLRTAFQRWSLC